MTNRSKAMDDETALRIWAETTSAPIAAGIITDNARRLRAEWEAEQKQEPVAWEEPQHLAEQLAAMRCDGNTICPLCGDWTIHKHSPVEIVIYRNGVKYGRSITSSPHAPADVVMVPREPTMVMVEAYLDANAAYWVAADQLPPAIGKWRSGTSKQATIAGYNAMLAVAEKGAPK